MSKFTVGRTTDDKFYMLRFEIDDEISDRPEFEFRSSYHVLDARLLGLSYPDYLKFCSSKGAKLRGRKGYTYPIWEKEKDCKEICQLLNKEWSEIRKVLIGGD